MSSMNDPVAGLDELIEPSRPRVMRCFPSTEKAVAKTQSECWSTRRTSLPDSTSTILAELSAHPNANFLPSGVNAPP